jgi:peptide/nickel transport system substrate-binding protein
MSPRHRTTSSSAAARARRAAATALVCALAACSPRARRTPDDTLVVLIESAIRAADPRYTLSNYDTKLSRLIAPGLTSVDTATTEPELMLAEAIERKDDVTWDVTVRSDARFSDGSPVTAADVVFSYQSMLADDSDSVYHKTYGERFVRVEALDERRARFHLRRPLATLMTDLDHGILSARAAGPSGRFGTRPPVGAGAYRLVELTAAHARLEANPHYFRAAPHLPKVELRFVRDQAARILMLAGGSADLLQNAVRLDLVEDVLALPRVELERGPSQLLTYLMFNNEDPVLARKEVRQAIALAIDREGLIVAKYAGRAVLATGLLPPGSPYYNGDVPRWNYDPARARRMLDEVGLRDPDGPGPKPRLSLSYKTSADAFRVSVARVIAAQLAEVGIAVEVRSFEFATFFADIKKGQFQLASMQTAEIGNPDYYFTYFHSSRIPSEADKDANNRWRYRNARVDELCQAGRDELDATRRRALYAEVQRLVAEDVPIAPLWHEDNVVLHNRDVTGFAMTPNARFGGFTRVQKGAAAAAR